jgi:branched-chain amino acid transport system ATP-binding protein
MLLEVKDLNVHYGGIHAVHGISLNVHDGQIVALLGANGAGKSSTLRAIMGLVKPTSGSIALDGENLAGLRSFEVVRRGVAMVPEGRRVFTNLTVAENLRLGAYARKDEQAIQHDIKEIFNLFPRLEERKSQSAGTLSGGEQQMLALGRALMCKPRVLMIDEPSLGLAPVLAQGVFAKLKDLNESGQTILLIEQNARAALAVSDYAYILEIGEIVLEGPADKLAEMDEVRQFYLGVH